MKKIGSGWAAEMSTLVGKSESLFRKNCFDFVVNLNGGKIYLCSYESDEIFKNSENARKK